MPLYVECQTTATHQRERGNAYISLHQYGRNYSHGVHFAKRNAEHHQNSTTTTKKNYTI